MRNNRIRFTSLLFLFSLISLSTYAQKRHGFEGDFGLQVSDFDIASSYATFKYNHRLNTYMALNLGLNFVYSEIDKAFDSPFEQRTFYDLSDDIVNMNFVTGLKLSSPTWKNFGTELDLDFQFEPIPFNPLSIEKKTLDLSGDYYITKDVGKSVYSRFNPSYHVQFSIFYQLKKNDSRLRIALGYGITNYNVYNGYYRATVEGAQLSRHLKLKPNKIGSSVFLRIAI